jgi:hypothetical protein
LADTKVQNPLLEHGSGPGAGTSTSGASHDWLSGARNGVSTCHASTRPGGSV